MTCVILSVRGRYVMPPVSYSVVHEWVIHLYSIPPVYVTYSMFCLHVTYFSWMSDTLFHQYILPIVCSVYMWHTFHEWVILYFTSMLPIVCSVYMWHTIHEWVILYFTSMLPIVCSVYMWHTVHEWVILYSTSISYL